MHYTIDELRLTSVGPLKLRTIAKINRRDKLDDARLTPGQALLLWTSDWLSRRRPITEEQQTLIVTEFADDIVRIGNDAEEANKEAVEVAQLILLDNTLAGLSGLPNYLDLRTGETVESLTQMPIEVYSLSLTAMYKFHARRVMLGRKNAARESARIP